MRLKRLCRPPRPYHRFRARQTLKTSNPRELLNCRLLGLTSISVQGILRSSVYTQPGITSSSMKKAATCFSQVAALPTYWSPYFLILSSVNSIAGLGLAGLDVELVLFGGGG